MMTHGHTRHFYIVALLLTGVGLLFFSVHAVRAQSADVIQKKIEDRNEKIEQLEREIAEYEQNLRVVGKEKQTLETAIQTLDLSQRKISTDISLTQQKINATDLTIGELEKEIEEKSQRVERNKQALGESIRSIHTAESDTLVETLLARNNLSEVWEQVETLERFQSVLQDDVQELTLLRAELETRKEETEEKRKELASYRLDLSGKKRVLDQNREEKDQLLEITENKEANFQTLLEAKVAARKQFERELQDLEAQLQYTLDPNSVPQIGQGVLGWPLDNLVVTQYFGNTPFAQSGAYSGSGHNGMDFGVSQGTPVRSSLGGIIEGTGNTDQFPGCYSYGKWILVRHNNGLSTLYAHLSVISVSPGEPVSTGEIIGYSGNTGYSTGPHLHYSVYVSEAVQIVRLGDVKKITNCGPAHIPIAPLEAYLNPLDYLDAAHLLR